MNVWKKLITLILAAALLACFGAASALGEEEPAEIVLHSYEDNGEYQFIELGYYPFTSGGSEQPILWRVLSVSDDIALLRSEYAIDVYRGNKYSSPEDILENLCDRSFGTLMERGAILTKSIPSEADLNSNFYGYSREGINEARMVEVTPYSASHGVLSENGYAGYWTYSNGKASYVTPNGGIIPLKRTMQLGVVPMITASISELRLDQGSGTIKDPYRSTYSDRNVWFDHNMLIHFFEDERHIYNPYRKRIDVYTGPGEDYYLPEDASINMHETKVTVLAREGSYLLIEYMVTGYGRPNRTHHYKTGYIYEPNALVKAYNRVHTKNGWKNYIREYDNEALPHKQIDAYTVTETTLYDDRNLKSQPLYILEEGRGVDLLGYVEHNDIMLGYVEVEIYDQKARGFVLLENLESDDYDFNFLTVR